MTEIVPKSSDSDQVVYGIAVSENCSTLAVVSGLNNQYLRQYRLSSEMPPELISEDLLKSRYNRPVKLYYSESDSYLWVEQEKSLNQYHEGSLERVLPVEGTLLTQFSDEESGFIYVLSQLESPFDITYEITVFSLNGSIVMRNHFDQYPEFFSVEDEQIFLSMDDKLLVLKREES
jgi:hypothetical protein